MKAKQIIEEIKCLLCEHEEVQDDLLCIGEIQRVINSFEEGD